MNNERSVSIDEYHGFLNALHSIIKAAAADEDFDSFEFLNILGRIPFPTAPSTINSLSMSLVRRFSYEADINAKQIERLLGCLNSFGQRNDGVVYDAAMVLTREAVLDPAIYLERFKKLSHVSDILIFLGQHQR